ncbi:hypothetical protein XENORESO_020492 [Xenotaenia resolanae]|uniref:Uncharacterized protein n=1 Tax=Xenotaenia resolanae TaxID=208358 RepID=A0ABV0W9T1_9TELE
MKNYELTDSNETQKPDSKGAPNNEGTENQSLNTTENHMETHETGQAEGVSEGGLEKTKQNPKFQRMTQRLCRRDTEFWRLAVPMQEPWRWANKTRTEPTENLAGRLAEWLWELKPMEEL